jgi:hypothetical protein
MTKRRNESGKKHAGDQAVQVARMTGYHVLGDNCCGPGALPSGRTMCGVSSKSADFLNKLKIAKRNPRVTVLDGLLIRVGNHVRRNWVMRGGGEIRHHCRRA